MRSNYGQKSYLVAVQSGEGYIYFTKPFYSKWVVEFQAGGS